MLLFNRRKVLLMLLVSLNMSILMFLVLLLEKRIVLSLSLEE